MENFVMADSLHVDPQVIAHRCPLQSPDYASLTPLDWVVLDFTDGNRSFAQLISMLPASQDDLTTAMIHLRLLGLLTWTTPAVPSASAQTVPDDGNHMAAAIHTLSGLDNAQRQVTPEAAQGSSKSMQAISLSGHHAAVEAQSAIQQYSDELCKKYLPERLLPDFRKFKPTLTDEKLDISIEMQIFTEFLHDNLSMLTPWDLLGVAQNSTDKAAIRQAYMQKTKLFHPDRYFRKNLGAFAPRIAAIFKAISSAFTTLQK